MLRGKKYYQDRLEKWKNSGEAPEWMTWMAIQMLMNGYIEDKSPKQRYMEIAETAAKRLPEDQEKWKLKFFEIMWKGWMAPSTPVMANMGTRKGMPVSCSGTHVEDSLYDIYQNVLENAILTKYGFGTSSNLSSLRARGDSISRGGYSSGVVSWIEQFKTMTDCVTQGTSRRGAWAGYIDIESKDLDDVLAMQMSSNKLNTGVLVTDKFKKKLAKGDKKALKRYQKVLQCRMVKGRPYIIFIDNANRQNPQCYRDKGWTVKASNLCTEIFLNSDNQHSFTCVLSSMNCTKFDEWKDTDAVYTATVFLDCVAEDFIKRASNIPGLEKTVKFTMKSRALGLGLLGFHTYLQQKMIPLDSFQAMMVNDQVFKHLSEESLRASKDLANWLGEPFLLKGTGLRNSHRLAVAPNTSSALICGSVSQGIEPIAGNYYIQRSAKGKFERMNPVFLELLDKKGMKTQEVLNSVALKDGSVQHLDFLSQEEKQVFKTAYEINQMVLIELAERRQRFIDQGQSLNLFFSSNESPEWIHEVHKRAFQSETLKSLYYVRSDADIKADKGSDCIACEG